MIAVCGLLTIVILSVIAVRIGGTALELTGLSPDIASFQALSAFSGVGFTTRESESIVTHPVRRRIVRILILMGSVGTSSTIATLILTFVGQTESAILHRSVALVSGLLIILFLTWSKHLNQVMKRIITRWLGRMTALHLYDYEQVLGLSRGYTITKTIVTPESPLKNRSLKELRLDLQGVLVLAINRTMAGQERFIGAPTGSFIVRQGDTVICYAREDANRAFTKVHDEL